MFSHKSLFIKLLFFLITVTLSKLNGMQSSQEQDLIPKFVPSLRALTLMRLVGNARCCMLYHGGEKELPLYLQEKK